MLLELKFWSRPQHPLNSGAVHPFIGNLTELKIQELMYVMQVLHQLQYFSLFFMDMMQLLLAVINKHYNQYLVTCNSGDSSLQLADVTVEEVYVFMALVTQIGHGELDTLKEYWSTLEWFYTSFLYTILQ
jgi:hypothetical protein